MQLVADISKLAKENPDPIFQAHAVTDRILSENLEKSEWLDLMRAFSGSGSPVVISGIAGALAKKAHDEYSALEIHDLFPFLNSCDLDHIVASNLALSAVQQWLIVTPLLSISDETVYHILNLLARCAEKVEGATKSFVLDILESLVTDIKSAQRQIPSYAQCKLENLLIHLADSDVLLREQKQQAQEVLTWIGFKIHPS